MTEEGKRGEVTEERRTYFYENPNFYEKTEQTLKTVLQFSVFCLFLR